jgi:hypothetical protein
MLQIPLVIKVPFVLERKGERTKVEHCFRLTKLFNKKVPNPSFNPAKTTLFANIN